MTTAAGLEADAPDMPAPHVHETQAHGIAGGAALLLTLFGAVVGLALLVGGVLPSTAWASPWSWWASSYCSAPCSA